MFSAALNAKLEREAKKREEKQRIDEKLKVIRSSFVKMYLISR